MFLEIEGTTSVPLDNGQLYMIGKQINVDISKTKNFIELEDEENVSQRHCVIETNHDEEVFVFDLCSLKGTVLNNQVLNSLEKTLLKNGDVIKIGGKEIKYTYHGHETSPDSSGFLEVQKNTSNIIASSPESTSQFQNCVKRLGDHNFLIPTRPSTSLSNGRSDSFTIPETQHCKSRLSINESNLSIAESIPENDGKIKFNFGNLDSFEENDFCIPETQELITAGKITSSQRPRLLSNMRNKDHQASVLNEESSTLGHENATEGSQFRICTQDYNEGFGEEETDASLRSQIIPIIKHSTLVLNDMDSSNTDLINHPISERAEKETSSLDRLNSKTDQETTHIRADCLTPDLFEFEAITNKINDDIDKQDINILNEDEEDLLPTQCVPPLLKKIEDKKSLDKLEEACLDKEIEEVFILSDKENRCPERDALADMQQTQLFAVNSVKSHTSISNSNSLSSVIKLNNLQEDKSSTHSLLTTEPDEEDELLTQAFLPPKSVSVSSSGSSSKIVPVVKCLNSTTLDDKCTEKTPVTFFAEMEKTPLKQMPNCSANVFKKPDKDFGILKKTSSASSTASENYVDLLMCTPQLITDNWSLDKSEDLRKHILAVKNKNLFGDDTEDEEDDQSDLVKIINVPKNSLDFDKLLPHLNQKSQSGTEERVDQNEAQKIYKFNVSFGKEQDEMQSKTSTYKSSAFSRDERHAAREKEREISERKEKMKSKPVLSKRQEQKIARKEIESKEKKEDKEKKNKERLEKKKQNAKDKERKLKEKTSKNEVKSESSDSNKTEQRQKRVQIQFSKDEETETDNKPESSTRLRKRRLSEKNEIENSKSNNKQKPMTMPARRLTRSRSRLEESSPLSKAVCNEEDDIDNIPTQPIVKIKRSRSKTKQNDSIDTSTSNISTKSNESRRTKTDQNKSDVFDIDVKKTERKRKGEAPATAIPAKIERKQLRSLQSQESLSSSSLPSVSISITNVDQELIKNLLKNAKGLWNIAANAADSDILVMDKPLRTFKFLLAMARGIPIVTTEYLKTLNESKSPEEVHFNDYHFSDNDFEKKYKFSLLKSLRAAKKQQIFKDYEFLITPNILPIPEEIRAIIKASGGYVHNKNPPPAKENQNLYLITTKEDKKDWHKYRRLNKNIIIISTEAIMSAIMCQSSERMKSFTLA